jgi:hypothetical protein
MAGACGLKLAWDLNRERGWQGDFSGFFDALVCVLEDIDILAGIRHLSDNP